jgi:hypothetical protein
MIDSFIAEIVNCDSLGSLILSNYGNYIVQKGLKISNMKARYVLIKLITHSLKKIKKSNVVSKWKHIIEEYYCDL